MKKNALVGQSGGPTAVINASLYGIITESMKHKEEIGAVYGMVNGIEGFLADRFLNLSESLSQEDLEILKLTPAAYLGSCRYKLPEDLTCEAYPTLFRKFEALDIGYFFYIGGNDSMDTVSKLSRYAAAVGSPIRVIGIPKTIDNDLVLTDHTPGFGSAAKYVASAVREIVLDATVYQQRSVTIVELMGRHAGWLTASSVLARKHKDDNPLLIYLPESAFSLEQFSADLKRAFKKNANVVVCVSEGLSDARGKFICEYSNEAQVDTFGHKMLTGCGKILENFVRQQFQVKVRSIELNVCQRCSGMTVSKTDVEEASMAGACGVAEALKGTTGKMIAFVREPGEEYRISCAAADVNQICNKEKTFPAEWITAGGTDIGPEFTDYALPLIQGEAERKMDSGVPVYLYRK